MSGDLCVVDITALLFRAYFGKMRRKAPNGVEVGAVWGTLMILRKIFDKYPPKRVAFVFDSPGDTFRTEIDDSYKANRGAPPEDLEPQFGIVFELCKAMGVRCFIDSRYEADDFMASLAVQARRANVGCLLFSTDKDINQLVVDESPTVVRIDIHKDKVHDEQAVFDKMGVFPAAVVDFQALVGDSVDNIAGVRGVGAKSAAAVINHFSSLDSLYDSLDEVSKMTIRGAKSLQMKLKTGRDDAYLSRSLVLLKDDIDLQLSDLAMDLKWQKPLDGAEDAFMHWGLSRYLIQIEEACMGGG